MLNIKIPIRIGTCSCKARALMEDTHTSGDAHFAVLQVGHPDETASRGLSCESDGRLCGQIADVVHLEEVVKYQRAENSS